MYQLTDQKGRERKAKELHVLLFKILVVIKSV